MAVRTDSYWRLLMASRALLDRLDGMTTEEFKRGGEKQEREELRSALDAIERYLTPESKEGGAS